MRTSTLILWSLVLPVASLGSTPTTTSAPASAGGAPTADAISDLWKINEEALGEHEVRFRLTVHTPFLKTGTGVTRLKAEESLTRDAVWREGSSSQFATFPGKMPPKSAGMNFLLLEAFQETGASSRHRAYRVWDWMRLYPTLSETDILSMRWSSVKQSPYASMFPFFGRSPRATGSYVETPGGGYIPERLIRGGAQTVQGHHLTGYTQWWGLWEKDKDGTRRFLPNRMQTVYLADPELKWFPRATTLYDSKGQRIIETWVEKVERIGPCMFPTRSRTMVVRPDKDGKVETVLTYEFDVTQVVAKSFVPQDFLPPLSNVFGVVDVANEKTHDRVQDWDVVFPRGDSK